MRRPALIVSLLLLAAAILVRLRRRAPARSLAGAAPAGPLPSPPLQLPAPPPESRFVSVPWTLVAAADDEPAVTIGYRAEAPMELDRIDAQETPTQVFVTVLMRRREPTADTPARAGDREAVVPLSRPLGERELVHAPVDEPNDRPLYP